MGLSHITGSSTSWVENQIASMIVFFCCCSVGILLSIFTQRTALAIFHDLRFMLNITIKEMPEASVCLQSQEVPVEGAGAYENRSFSVWCRRAQQQNLHRDRSHR